MDKAAAAGGNPDERSKLLSEAEAVCVRDTGQHAAALLQLSQPRIAAAQGLGGQCDGRPSDALHQQGIVVTPDGTAARRFGAAAVPGAR